MAIDNVAINGLIESAADHYRIDTQLYNNYQVKRGLRNPDGTGVLAGLTSIGEVRGYVIDNGERMPIEGKLMFRGVNARKIIENAQAEGRFAFEEAIFLLLFGFLPNKKELEVFNEILGNLRELPDSFTEDTILKNPSPNIMNKLARCVLSLYTYDDDPENQSLANMIRQSLELISRMVTMSAYAYHAKGHYYDNKSLYIHSPKKEYSTAQNFLHLLRPDSKFTDIEAQILDTMLVLHAEHGGGNNSAFSCRVVSSSGTDTYSAIASAISSLKGPKHGGANAKVMDMMQDIKAGVSDWKDEEELSKYLWKIVNKEAADGSGLIYGMGHAVYTLSDPRAVVIKEKARQLAEIKGCMDEFNLYDSIERLSPGILTAKIGNKKKPICANVDLYSGFLYKMMDIPEELYTPLFAIARIAGWCAHRIEEVRSNGKIIRPAFKSVCERVKYVPIDER